MKRKYSTHRCKQKKRFLEEINEMTWIEVFSIIIIRLPPIPLKLTI